MRRCSFSADRAFCSLARPRDCTVNARGLRALAAAGSWFSLGGALPSATAVADASLRCFFADAAALAALAPFLGLPPPPLWALAAFPMVRWAEKS